METMDCIYYINHDLYGIISGETRTTHPAYLESVKELDDGKRSFRRISKLMGSIHKLKVSDSRISSSKGNINEFKGYDNIQKAIKFLDAHIDSDPTLKHLNSIFSALTKYSNDYSTAYAENVDIIKLEYENSLYILITGLSYLLASKIDVSINTNGVANISNVKSNDSGFILKIIEDLSNELENRNHQDYLKSMIKAKSQQSVNESTKYYQEIGVSTVTDTASIIQTLWGLGTNIFKFTRKTLYTIKQTLFGIIPLIRSIIYLRYKHKADQIISLDNQVRFIEINVDQLKNITTMNNQKKSIIIKKQQAKIEAYKKKSAKLRAELGEAEREASEELKRSDIEIKNDKNNSNDDFILENFIY